MMTRSAQGSKSCPRRTRWGALAALMTLAGFTGGCDFFSRDGDEAKGDGAVLTPNAPSKPFERAEGQPPPNPAASFAGPFAAAGAEPFWSAEIDGGEITFSRPEEPPVTAKTPALRAAGGVLKFNAGPLQVTIVAQPCVDASGEPQAYRMQVIEGGVAYEGCAKEGRFESGPGKDWAGVVLDLMPAIDSCLAQTPGPQPRVTMAHAMSGGQVSVRIIDGLRGRYLCSAPRGGGDVALLEPIPQGDYLDGEGTPILSRVPTSAPGGECFRTEELKDKAGQLVGWLSYDQC